MFLGVALLVWNETQLSAVHLPRFLVVDDQPELSELIQAILEGEGHTVEAVTSGQAALERLAAARYDLVVCDLQMPDVDGAAVYRVVEQRAPPRPMVLLMTGHAKGAAYAEFLQTTRVAVLSRPVGLDDLRARVRGMLEAR